MGKEQVLHVQTLLLQCGFPPGPLDGIFGKMTYAALVAFQTKHGLNPNGVPDDKTYNLLSALHQHASLYVDKADIDTQQEVEQLPALLPQNALDARISDSIYLMQTCDGGQGCRYGGWIDPYQFDSKEFREGATFPIPRVGKIVPGSGLKPPLHGGTCSPWAGEYLGWYLCANQDYNFRIGRSARWMATWRYDHVEKGIKIPGYGDYTEINGVLKLEHHPLDTLYRDWNWLYKVNIVEMDTHVILVLKVGGENGLHLYDPKDPKAALSCGLYRLGADGYYPKVNGSKYYSGTKQSFVRITGTMKCSQGWDFYRVKDVGPDECRPTSGPWADRVPRALVLE